MILAFNKLNYFNFNRSKIYQSSYLIYKKDVGLNRYYSNSALDRYLSKNKLNVKNINKVLEVLENKEYDKNLINEKNILDVSGLKNLGDYEKLNKYELAISFDGIDSLDDVFNNLEVDENDILYKEYRLKFIDLINQLKKDQIYKVVFR